MTLSVIDGGNTEGRQAPNAYEAEREVLAVCLVWPQENMPRVLDAMPPEQLYNRALRVVWEAMRELWAERRALDPLLLTQWLKDRGRFEVAGGMKTISSLMERAGLLGDLSHYLDVIAEKWRKRRLLTAAAVLERLGWEDGVSAEEAMREVDEQYRALSRDTAHADLGGDRAAAVVDDLMRLVNAAEDARNAGQSLGLSFGIQALDDALHGGPWPGEVVTILGQRGDGKSALASQVIVTACESGRPGLFYSAEMKPTQVMGRLNASISGVPVHVQRSGRMTHDERSRFTEAADIVHGWPLGVVKASGWHIGQVQRHARQWVRDHGPVDFIVLDYLQKLRSPPGYQGDTVGTLSVSSGGMKELALELDCVAIQLSQPVNAATREARRLKMADAKGSGAIADDSDVFLVVHRPTPEAIEPDLRKRVEIAIEKAREGEGRGTVVQARFNGRRMRFEDDAW